MRWTQEMIDWIIANRQLSRQTRYAEFIKIFNVNIKAPSFYCHCSKVYIQKYGYADKAKAERLMKPLYAEQIRNGCVFIKVAQPKVWISKAKWVYMETHPWEDYTNDTNNFVYIFLDGDNRNFNPDNIERVPREIWGYLNHWAVKGNADTTKLEILNAKLIMKTLDIGEKLGLTYAEGSGRHFKDRAREYHREYKKRNRKKLNKCARDYYHRIKNEKGEKYQQRLERNRNIQAKIRAKEKETKE